MNVDIKGLHNTAIFKWLDPTPYLDADLPNQKVEVQPTTDNIYRVQVGAFENKSYAVRRANEVKGKGFDAALSSTRATTMYRLGRMSGSGEHFWYRRSSR